jgi:hypothetical protein
MVKIVNEALREPMWAQRGKDVLLAMRDAPTPAMLDAGYEAACQHDCGETVPFSSIAIAVWQAMIDEALK